MSSSRKISFENRDRFIELGLNIAYYRKWKGYTQEALAERVGISRTHLANIESPNTINSFSLEVLFNIARSLEIEPSKLLEHRK